MYPEAITKAFSKAKPVNDAFGEAVEKAEAKLKKEQKSFLLATSICSDDLNTEQFPKTAKKLVGPFVMGGLGGYPFTGNTGMAAYAGHIPDNGVLFFFYGPHIGVNAEGTLTEVHRPGQSDPKGHSCGAVIGAVGAAVSGAKPDSANAHADYQMNFLKTFFYNKKDELSALKGNKQAKKAVELLYEEIDTRMNELVSAEAYAKYDKVLLGGIYINADKGKGAWFQTKRFDIIKAK